MLRKRTVFKRLSGSKGREIPDRPSPGLGVRCTAVLLSLLVPAAWAEIEVTGGIDVPEGLNPQEVRVRLVPVVSAYELAGLRLAGRLRPEHVSESLLSEDGWYRLTAPGAGMWKVVASAPGAATLEHVLSPLTDDTHLGRFTLQPEVVRELRVTDSEGEAVSDVRVVSAEAEPGRRHPGEWPAAVSAGRTDSSGRLSLGELPREAAPLIAIRGAAEQTQVRPVAGRLVIADPPLVEYRLQLLELGGEPVEKAIAVTRHGRWPVAETTAEGDLSLELPVGRQADLDLLTDDGREVGLSIRAEPGATAADERTLTVTIPGRRELEFAGAVVDDESGSPLAGAIAWSAPRKTFVTGEDGTYVLPKSSTVSVAATGYSPKFWRAGAGTQARDPTPPPVRLQRAMEISGRVRDERGQPVTAGRVTASRALDRHNADSAWSSVSSWAVELGPGGRFFFNKLYPDDYRLSVTADGFAEKRIDVGKPSGSRSVTGVEVVLHGSLTLTGRRRFHLGLVLSPSPSREPDERSTSP